MLADRIILRKLGKRNIILVFLLFCVGYISHMPIWLYKLGSGDAESVSIFHYTLDHETQIGR